MHYHNAVIGLFEPLGLGLASPEPTEKPPPLTTVADARTMAAHSRNCLQTLMRLYFSCHGLQTYGFFLAHFSMFIGFGALTELGAAAAAGPNSDFPPERLEALQSTLILCAAMLHAQSRNFYMAETVFRLLLAALPPPAASRLRALPDVDIGAGAGSRRGSPEAANPGATGTEVEVAAAEAEVAAVADAARTRRLVQHLRSEWPIGPVQSSGRVDDRRLDGLLRAMVELSMEGEEADAWIADLSDGDSPGSLSSARES